MRVLHITGTLAPVGGAEMSMGSLLRHLWELGVESSIVSILGGVGGLVDQVSEPGSEIQALHGSNWPPWVAQLRSVILQPNPDLVHVSFVNSCLATRVACIGLSVWQLNSLVNTTKDLARTWMPGIAPWKLRVLRTIDGFTVGRLCDRFHAIANTVRDEAVNVLGVYPVRETVVYSGRSARSLGENSAERGRRTRRSLGIDLDISLLPSVGRQDNQKAQANLTRAFGRVLVKNSEVVLLVVGRQRNATQEVDAERSELTTPESVRTLGYRTDVEDLLHA